MGSVRAVDSAGAIRVQRSRALVRAATPAAVGALLEHVWRITTGDGLATHTPGLFLLHGPHVIDLSGVETLAQAVALARGEVAGLPADERLALIGVP